MQNKICVYTCITGKYDTLKEIDNMEGGIDYYCFTNNHSLLSNTWKIIYLDDENCNNILLCRKIKILGHPVINNYDLSLWIDGSLKIVSSVSDFIKKYCSDESYSMYTFKHHERDCIYEEAQVCINLGKANLEDIKKQMQVYKKAKYPEHNGLVETGIIVRRNNDIQLKHTMSLWYEYLVRYTTRDQLSFNFIAYINNFKYYAIPLNIFDNTWFRYINHASTERPEHFLINFEVKSDFSDYTSVQGSYKVIEDNFIAQFQCPVDAERIIYNPTYCTGYFFKDLKINGALVKDYEKSRCEKYGYNYITTNSYTCLIINYPCKKDDIIKLEIQMQKLELIDIIKDRIFFDNER